jgi:hypothetical protein
LLAFDAVFSIERLMLFRHLPEHCVQSCLATARSELYRLAYGKFEIHGDSSLILRWLPQAAEKRPTFLYQSA